MNKCSEVRKLLEIDIKAIVLDYLKSRSQLISGCSIISEFTVDRHSRRADLVVAQSGRLIGFEIKSEVDSLSRLAGQTEKYLDYFDKVVIVAAPKHIPNIIAKTPLNVGVWEVSQKGVKVVRRGKIITITNKGNLLKLMTVSELSKLANKYKLSLKLKSKSRRNLEAILQNLSVSIIHAAAVNFVKVRYSLTSNFFFNMLGESKVSPEYVKLLSQSNIQENSLSFTDIEDSRLWSNLNFVREYPNKIDCRNTCLSNTEHRDIV